MNFNLEPYFKRFLYYSMVLAAIIFADKAYSQHAFLCSDSRTHQVRLFSESGELLHAWPANAAVGLSVLENGNILTGGGSDAVEITPDGKIVFRVELGYNSYSAQRLPNGNTLVGEGGKFRFTERAPDGTIVKVVSTKGQKKSNAHMHSRCIKLCSDNTYWVTLLGAKKLAQHDLDGKCIKTLSVKKILKEAGIKAEEVPGPMDFKELDNGNFLISCIYPGAVLEITPKGKLVWSIFPNDVPEVNLGIGANCAVRLDNGNTVICNWTAHNYEGEYIPVFEVNREKEIVWKFEDKELVPEPLSIVIMDNKDLSIYKGTVEIE